MKTILAFLAAAALATGLSCSSVLQPQDDVSRRVDYLRNDIEKLAKQQETLAAEVHALQAATGTAPAEASRNTQSGDQEVLTAQPLPGPAPESGQLASDPGAEYQRAYDLLTAGRYAESQTAFAQFIRDYPQSDLADNAQYWIGEGFYATKAFSDARAAFQGVVDHFPFGNKVPDALYKRALCEGQLGDKSAERQTLRDLIEQYPFSEAAVKGRELLQKLG